MPRGRGAVFRLPVLANNISTFRLYDYIFVTIIFKREYETRFLEILITLYVTLENPYTLIQPTHC
jgi:hypothetical protein